MGNRFTLEPRHWYAAEFFGDFFADFGPDQKSYSPIKVYDVIPHKSGHRLFDLKFHHSNYPSGVQGKRYRLKTLERGQHFILARSTEHKPYRFMLIYAITADWLKSHFHADVRPENVIDWLERNAYS